MSQSLELSLCFFFTTASKEFSGHLIRFYSALDIFGTVSIQVITYLRSIPHIMAAPVLATLPPRRLVLCFDGTRNKFTGDETDTNIVKIYKMLDRGDPNQFHYYQRKFSRIIEINY